MSTDRVEGSVRPPFVMLMVPPNLTGDLHLGHALMLVVQDSLARSRRLRGDEVVYVPGVDHAGIGMYSLVASAHDFMPDRPIDERLVAWAGEHRRRIREQIQRLNVACDWGRETYTMDPHYVAAVHSAFRDLAAAGFIRRERAVMPWCPSCGTTVAEIESTVTTRTSDVALCELDLDHAG